MKTISIINLKGGVAKTISAINIAYVLAAVHGKRVCLSITTSRATRRSFPACMTTNTREYPRS